MSNLNDLQGTFTLDPSHTEIGFVARHAMVTKVRGFFNEFEGTARTQRGLQDAHIDVTIQAASVNTKNTDRDNHLRGDDFFDVEQYPTITFRSTTVSASSEDVLHVEGDLTIKNVTRPVAIDFDYEGEALDPFGNTRVGLEGEVKVNRKDFGLEWNAALETGGVLVSEEVTLTFEISAIKQADAETTPATDAAAQTVSDEPYQPAVENTTLQQDAAPAAPQATAPQAQQAQKQAETGGIVGWFKKTFGSKN